MMQKKSKFIDKWGFDRLASKYDHKIKKAAEQNDWMYRKYSKILHKILEYSSVNKDKNIKAIDIGTGTGNLASLFIKKGVKIIGIEPSKKMRVIARKKIKNTPILEGHFLDIPLKNKSIDLIVSSLAFHHLTELEKTIAITEMKRVLKPKGRIVIADLMFKNKKCKKKIKEELIRKGKQDIIDAINDEYYGFFDNLRKKFTHAGFKFEGEQLTEFVWIFRASLRNLS